MNSHEIQMTFEINLHENQRTFNHPISSSIVQYSPKPLKLN